MPALRQPGDGVAARLAAGGPEVETRFGMVDGEPGRPQRRQQRGPAPLVAFALLAFVVVVVERGDHRGLHRRRHHHPGVLAHRQQLGDHRRVAGDEAGAIAGQRRGLRQRVHGQQPGVVAVADRRMQHRERRGVPAQARDSTRRRRRARRDRAPSRPPCADGRHPAPCRSGLLGEFKNTSAGDCGPSWVSESARTTGAPASRAPTS